MNVKIGYYPIVDMILAIRQIYCIERFKPFSSELESVHSKLEEGQLKNIFFFGDITSEWLDVIERIIKLIKSGTTSPEEMILKIMRDPAAFIRNISLEDNEKLIIFIKDCWLNLFSSKAVNYSRIIFENTMEISTGVDKMSLFDYLLKTSDRLVKIDACTLKYKITPEHHIDFNKIDMVVLMPSIYASRDLTFWHSGNDYIFYLSLETYEQIGIEPSGMLLIKTLALNDKTRLKILRLLSKKNYCVSEISEILNMNSSTISRHFKVFKDANFVDILPQQANSVYYTLKTDEIKNSMNDILEYIRGDKN